MMLLSRLYLRRSITIFKFVTVCLYVEGQDSTAPNVVRFNDTVFTGGSYITGNVQIENSPAVGVNVMVKGKVNVSLTDINGNFRLDADSNARLVFSYVGFNDIETNANVHFLKLGDMSVRISNIINKSTGSKVITKTVPVFPIPYPPPSASYLIDLPVRWNINSYGKADSVMRSALKSCGYSDRRYYPIKDGFALVTQMEQINGEGYSLKESLRWTYSIAHELNSPWEYLKSLFLAPKGNFRVIVFLISKSDPSTNPGIVTAESARDWMAGGQGSLPKELSGISGPVNIYMLVYQYIKSPGTDPLFLRPGNITGEQHFIRSKIERKMK
ncbi:carboxypeptidase-like regulatory domain-containing protein [Flavitalea sp.]|nr:carboxypeptidase-like regulatory domain-containing protein [Flavitalea sp.]